MKRLAVLLGVLSAIFSALVVRPVNSYQGFIGKSTATAQTPALTVLGALTAALGAMRRSRFAMATGVLGAFWGLLYLTRGSIVAGAVSHGLFNFSQVVIAYFVGDALGP